MSNRRTEAVDRVNDIIISNSDFFCWEGDTMTYRKGMVLEITADQWILLGEIGALIDLFDITIGELIDLQIDILRETM